MPPRPSSGGGSASGAVDFLSYPEQDAVQRRPGGRPRGPFYSSRHRVGSRLSRSLQVDRLLLGALRLGNADGEQEAPTQDSTGCHEEVKGRLGGQVSPNLSRSAGLRLTKVHSVPFPGVRVSARKCEQELDPRRAIAAVGLSSQSRWGGGWTARKEHASCRPQRFQERQEAKCEPETMKCRAAVPDHQPWDMTSDGAPREGSNRPEIRGRSGRAPSGVGLGSASTQFTLGSSTEKWSGQVSNSLGDTRPTPSGRPSALDGWKSWLLPCVMANQTSVPTTAVRVADTQQADSRSRRDLLVVQPGP